LGRQACPPGSKIPGGRPVSGTLDLHIQAFRIAGELSNPVMVCMDGFLLTQASERADIPAQAQVDAFVPCGAIEMGQE
jgi:hypothetical protein